MRTGSPGVSGAIRGGWDRVAGRTCHPITGNDRWWAGVTLHGGLKASNLVNIRSNCEDHRPRIPPDGPVRAGLRAGCPDVPCPAQRRRGARGRPPRWRPSSPSARPSGTRERVLPVAELDGLSASGLLASRCPPSTAARTSRPETVAEVFRLLAAGRPERRPDPAQPLRLRQRAAPPGHRGPAGVLLRRGAGGQAVRQRAVRGRHQARPGQPHHADPAGDRRWLLSGAKRYSTGALFADWIPVLRPPRRRTARCTSAWVDAATPPGVTVVDDWDGMGQRTTASGTVRLRRRRGARRPGHAVPPDLRGPADARRLRAAAARRDRRRHRPRGARRRRRSSSAPRAGPPGRRRGAGGRGPAGRAARSARWSSQVRAAEALLAAAARGGGRGRRAT